jgi:putative membrane protein
VRKGRLQGCASIHVMPGHTLADELAIERTRLANERTLLAYIRTGLAIAAGGIGVVHIMHGPLALLLGALLTFGGVATLVIGVWRFSRAKRELEESAARRSTGTTG